MAATTALAIVIHAIVFNFETNAPYAAVSPAGVVACVYANDGDTRRYRARRRCNADR